VTFARSAKMMRSVVDIWPGMTVAELAVCVKKKTGMFTAATLLTVSSRVNSN